MNDETAIANLVYRYAELIDAGDYDGIGALFADAVITADGSDRREARRRGDHRDVRQRHAALRRRHAAHASTSSRT